MYVMTSWRQQAFTYVINVYSTCSFAVDVMPSHGCYRMTIYMFQVYFVVYTLILFIIPVAIDTCCLVALITKLIMKWRHISYTSKQEFWIWCQLILIFSTVPLHTSIALLWYGIHACGDNIAFIELIFIGGNAANSVRTNISTSFMIDASESQCFDILTTFLMFIGEQHEKL